MRQNGPTTRCSPTPCLQTVKVRESVDGSMTFFFRVPEFEIEVRKQILQHRLHAHPDGRFGQRVGPAFQQTSGRAPLVFSM